MATTFRRGQELGRANGLNIFLKSKDGSPTNASMRNIIRAVCSPGEEALSLKEKSGVVSSKSSMNCCDML